METSKRIMLLFPAYKPGERLIAHMGIILSRMILVFYIIDMFNAKSLFMDSAAAFGASIVLSITSISMAVVIQSFME